MAAASTTTAGLLLLAFAADPWRVESLYVQGIGPWIAAVPLSVSRHVPFSIAEVAVVLAATAAVGWFVGVARALWWGDDRRATLLHALGRVYVAVSTVLVVFYVVWGLAYARPPLEHRQGWADPGDDPIQIDAAELDLLALVLVEKVNTLYLRLHGVPDGFAPTAAPHGLAAADASVERGFRGVALDLGQDPGIARDRGPTKALMSSRLFSWLRIGGIYAPFTAEANLNAMAPDWQQPFTMAHEKSHQRFVASENEANFHGFLACTYSDDPFVQYSGWLFAQRQVLRALAKADPYAFVHRIEQRLPGVQRDVDTAHAFWTGYEGPLADMSHAVNDAYLKANRVQGGVHSYGRSLELLVYYSRNPQRQTPR